MGKKAIENNESEQRFRSSHFPGPICGILITVSALLPEKRAKQAQETGTTVLCGWQVKGRGGMAAAQIPVHAPETVDSDGLFLSVPGL